MHLTALATLLIETKPRQWVSKEGRHRRRKLQLARCRSGIPRGTDISRRPVERAKPSAGLGSLQGFGPLQFCIQSSLAPMEIGKCQQAGRIRRSHFQKLASTGHVAQHQPFTGCDHRHTLNRTNQTALNLRTRLGCKKLKQLPPSTAFVHLVEQDDLFVCRCRGIALHQRNHSGIRVRSDVKLDHPQQFIGAVGLLRILALSDFLESP